MGKDNEALYFNTFTKSLDSDVSLNQVGGVFVFDNTNENSPWKKFTLGVNYNNTQNFDDELFIAGNGNTSIANFFLEQAQGTPFLGKLKVPQRKMPFWGIKGLFLTP